MIERNKMRMVTFYACYFVVLAIGTSLFNWFDVCDLLSWLRLLVVLILPFFISYFAFIGIKSQSHNRFIHCICAAGKSGFSSFFVEALSVPSFVIL